MIRSPKYLTKNNEPTKSKLYLVRQICGLHYKHMTIVNDNSSIINKLRASLTDDAGVIIYDHHMFIEQATEF
jgi:hypothetical protein